MNTNDSESIIKILSRLNYKETAFLEKADLIIINTCAIRAKAEQKVFSFLGRLSKIKQKRPDIIIAVGGCVAQQEGKKILHRAPYVDIVFGTHSINRLPVLIKRNQTEKQQIVDIEQSECIEEIDFCEDQHNKKITAFVTIMRGCDNYCAYCVVPHVRGREISREPDRVITEIKNLVASGIKEVTLLGQNVNSYGQQGEPSFPKLLARINDIESLLRIRFTTSHPKDLSDELILCFKKLSKLCNHIHLPVQSGSNKILQRMNRKYLKEDYIKKIDKLRDVCPDIAITSDFIVGFPGETITDYMETLDLIKRVEYDNIFAFKYSDRPNTAAAKFSDKVPEHEKKERLQNLLNLQRQYTTLKNQACIGCTETILVEGLSKKQTTTGFNSNKAIFSQWTGRTTANRIVNFSCDNRLLDHELSRNKVIKVIIEKAFSNSLWGRAIFEKPKAVYYKGGKSDAV